MTITQVFCTVDEMYEDLELAGAGREEKLRAKILVASQVVVMLKGRFLPVTEARTLGAVENQKNAEKLFIPPLLALTSIVNDGTTLNSSDYILQPNARHWDHGPYSMIEIAPDASLISAWDTDKDGIVITGKFGLYDRSEATGATLGAQLTDSATTMRVSNGGLVSVGMMALIGTEWIFVRATGTPVAAVTTLGAAWNASDDTFTAANGALLNAGEVIRCGVEQAKILDVNSNTVYVQRGWNGTKKAAHDSGANVDVYRNYTVERGANGSTAAAHDNATAISRQMVPADVNFLTRKIAGRMLLDATGGFKSRLGDDQNGVSIPLYILPKELEEILNMYSIPRMS